MGRLDLTDPLQGRRWLRLLTEDAECGFRLRPNLEVSRSELGFSCRSNALGLRGPADERAAGVVFGTSYAMGIAVDNGENWHELALPSAGWLNLGLAVGVPEWQTLLWCHHRGATDTALVLYHPNWWVIGAQFERWRQSGRGLFASQGWQTGFGKCLELKLRKIWRRLKARRRGEFLRFRQAGETYEIECGYVRFDVAQNQGLVEQALGGLQTLLAPFQRVIVARLPVKQELVPAAARPDLLSLTVASYSKMWAMLQRRLEDGRIQFHEPPDFTMADYHPADTHWNASGNARFAHWVRGLVA